MLVTPGFACTRSGPVLKTILSMYAFKAVYIFFLFLNDLEL
jgi:hypothetical protein